jgi:hypothetical protein
MIEMRWIEDGGGRSLQYRYFRTHRLDGNKATPLPESSRDYGWSPWIAVQTVSTP